MSPADEHPECPLKSKPVIGILGGVGAGKSTVAAEFGKLGCAVIDGDRIGQELLDQDEVKSLLRQAFGATIFGPDGWVDRQGLARRVFKHSSELDVLNSIMQSRIRKQMERLIDQAQKDPQIPAIVMDAAIMLEAGWDDLCTELVFVSSPADARERRVSQRGWDRQTWEDREKTQISLDRKRQRCYFTLDNSSSVSYLVEQIRELFNQIVIRRIAPGK